jgi:diguanylate cyclase (GGDEF)-like protein
MKDSPIAAGLLLCSAELAALRRRKFLIASAKTDPLPHSTALPDLALDTRLATIKREFVEKLWSGMLVLSAVGVPISVARAWDTGWLAVYTVHIGLGAGVALVYAVRQRLSLRWLSGLTIGLLWCVALPGVLSFGIAATGFYWLALSCLVAGFTFSRRTAFAVALVVILSLTAIGWGFVSGHIKPAINLDDYQRLPTAWAMLLVVTGVFLFVTFGAFKSQDLAVLRLLKEVEAQRKMIEQSASHDPLTDLPLRRVAEDRTSMAIQRAKRHDKKFALLFVDLDGFKSVNDTFGHEAGDAVLRLAARRMTSRLRGSDTVARIGGDEFLILLPDMGKATSAGIVAESLIESLSEPYLACGKTMSIGASIGIAVYPDHGQTGTELQHRADSAMYEAKRQGKGNYSYAQDDVAVT